MTLGLTATFLSLSIDGLFAVDPHSASQPQIQTMSTKEWTRLTAFHKAQLSVHQADVCFVGDSLTEFWTHHGADAWRDQFRGWKLVNCGIAADCTEHILFRLNALDLARAKPRVVVLLMGTNNLSKEPPDAPGEVARACETALDLIQKASPQTRILLLTIPPNTYEANSALRHDIRATNALLLKLAEQPRVEIIDTYPLFTDANDAWLTGCTLDGTHFSSDGYAVLADAIRPKLIEMLGAPSK